jgi:serine protease Do
MKKHGLFKNLAATLIAFVLIATVFGCGSGSSTSTPPASETSSLASTGAIVPEAGSNPAPTPSGEAGSDFAPVIREVANKVRPAVVQVTNEQYQPGNSGGLAVPVGVGSGVIYDSKGYVLTNNHVVEGANQLLVSLPDGRSFTGKLLGTDPRTDLAVVQISGSNLPVAELGDSSTLAVGDWVVAIGNALALPGGPTVTAGIVGALGRVIQEPSSSSSSTSAQGPYLFDLIQTDAPINPGNSGGPLINLNSQVVGINTLGAGSSSSGVQAEGIGFAISISSAKPIADQLVANGFAVHPYLGVSYIPLTAAIAAHYGVSQTQGDLVTSVVSGSPAASAGLKQGDVITAIDGQTLQGESDLAMILHQHQPGDTVTLTVQRGSQQLSVKVTLGEAPKS